MTIRVLSMVLHSFETDSRVLRACHSLIAAGYRVKVAALHERDLAEHQSIGELQVERIKLMTRGLPKWRPIQFLKYLEWCIRVGWRFRDFEIIHCNDINTLPGGLLLKALSRGRARVVYDAHEFESNHKSGQSRFSIWLTQVLEGALLPFVDRMVTVSEGIADEYARVYGIDRPAVVMNCPPRVVHPNEDRFRRRFGIRADQTIFLTQGWLRPNRGIEIMLEAFASMPDDSKVLVVMGRGALEAEVQAYAARSRNVFHHPVVPPGEVLVHTASADYGLALIQGTSFSYRHCMPNKLFEYLMAGLPVIVSDLPEMRRVVLGRDLGLVCEDLTPQGLVRACDALAARDRATLVQHVAGARDEFNWDVQQKVWLGVVRSLEQ